MCLEESSWFLVPDTNPCFCVFDYMVEAQKEAAEDWLYPLIQLAKSPQYHKGKHFTKDLLKYNGCANWTAIKAKVL